MYGAFPVCRNYTVRAQPCQPACQRGHQHSGDCPAARARQNRNDLEHLRAPLSARERAFTFCPQQSKMTKPFRTSPKIRVKFVYEKWKSPQTQGLRAFWWRQLESNQWPLACQASTLTSWAMPPFVAWIYYSIPEMKMQQEISIFQNFFDFSIGCLHFSIFLLHFCKIRI